MKLDVTREELELILNGLYSAANSACTMFEQIEYETLSDRIEKEWFKSDLNTL